MGCSQIFEVLFKYRSQQNYCKYSAINRPSVLPDTWRIGESMIDEDSRRQRCSSDVHDLTLGCYYSLIVQLWSHLLEEVVISLSSFTSPSTDDCMGQPGKHRTGGKLTQNDGR